MEVEDDFDWLEFDEYDYERDRQMNTTWIDLQIRYSTDYRQTARLMAFAWKAALDSGNDALLSTLCINHITPSYMASSLHCAGVPVPQHAISP